jgi:predicted kinase
MAAATHPPSLIVFSGLPGSGKSTLARLVAESKAAVWLRVDAIEAATLQAGVPRSFETGLAAYIVAHDLARDHLQLGRSAVIDAVNGVEEARAMWRDLSKETGARLFLLEVVCSDVQEHRRRVESRSAATPPLPAPTWQEVLAREFQPWKEPVLRVDSVHPPNESAEMILEYLEGRAGEASG